MAIIRSGFTPESFNIEITVGYKEYNLLGLSRADLEDIYKYIGTMLGVKESKKDQKPSILGPN